MIRQPGANSNPFVAIIMLTGHSEKKRVYRARCRHHGISCQTNLGQGSLRRHHQRGRQYRAPTSKPRPISAPIAAQRQSA